MNESPQPADEPDFEFTPDWIPAGEADALLTRLLARLPLKQESIVIAGRDVLQPRLTLWMGEPGAVYRYSGRTFVPAAWDPDVAELRLRVEARFGEPFNSVLLTLYRNGADAMGYHSDDEPELGPMPTIASVSLGATRRFLLKPRQKGARPTREFAMTHGSLLVMRGRSQAAFGHGVPREPSVQAPRLNLTFRNVVPASATRTASDGDGTFLTR